MTGDPVYDVIAAFAAGLAERGVTEVVISPGSRSTPLAITLDAQPRLRTWIQIDERSAGFFALGQAKVSGIPSVLVCTSGTAAANYLPAVVEAHHSGVPLIVCTADRPPELRDWGAGQTIDQVGIYGAATRWAADLPVAGDWTPRQARLAAVRAVDAATAVDAGPVHLNWPLREPLEPVDEVPVVEAASIGAPRSEESIVAPVPLPEIETARLDRGVIVVGPDAALDRAGRRRLVDAVCDLSDRTGWPVIGEPISGLRRTSSPTGARRVAHADHLLRIPEIAQELRPDLVVRIGGSPTTKAVRLWLEAHDPVTVLVDPARRWNDASFTVTHHVAADPIRVLRALANPGEDRTWSDRWAELDRVAGRVVLDAVIRGPLLSARTAAIVADAGAGSLVMTSNSMPVRDLDTFTDAAGPDVDFMGNRGASGIDGITSTALGLASAHDGPVVLFTGDLALLHDLGALFGAYRSGLRLTVVCIDNDGGGIFAVLPIAARDADIDFERLFRTPHGLDLRGFDGVGGVRVLEISSADGLEAALDESVRRSDSGVDLLLVTVDPRADVDQRRSIAAAVQAAVSS